MGKFEGSSQRRDGLGSGEWTYGDHGAGLISGGIARLALWIEKLLDPDPPPCGLPEEDETHE